MIGGASRLERRGSVAARGRVCDSEVKSEMWKTWVPPRVDIDPGLREAGRGENRRDHFALGSQPGAAASAVQEMATHVVNRRAIAANHAGHGMTAVGVERREAELTRAAVDSHPAVLTQTWSENGQIKAHTHVEKPLDVVKGSRFRACIRSQPQGVFIPTEVVEAALDVRQQRAVLNCCSERVLPMALAVSESSDSKLHRVQRGCVRRRRKAMGVKA